MGLEELSHLSQIAGAFGLTVEDVFDKDDAFG